MAAVSCGTSHVSAVSTPLRWMFKNSLSKAIHSCRITCEHSESARERSIALYKSDQQQEEEGVQFFCSMQAELSTIVPMETALQLCQ